MKMSARVTDLPLPQTREAENEEYETDVTSVGSYRSVDDVRMLRRVSIAVLTQSLLLVVSVGVLVFFASRRRHTRCYRDWSSDVCSSDLHGITCGHRPAV